MLKKIKPSPKQKEVKKKVKKTDSTKSKQVEVEKEVKEVEEVEETVSTSLPYLPSRTLKETRSLQCRLTSSEILERVKTLAARISGQKQLEAERKKLNSQLNGIKTAIDKLTHIIEVGKESRDVECSWQFDYNQSKKTLIRLDTTEYLETQTLTQDEIQMKLI